MTRVLLLLCLLVGCAAEKDSADPPQHTATKDTAEGELAPVELHCELLPDNELRILCEAHAPMPTELRLHYGPPGAPDRSTEWSEPGSGHRVVLVGLTQDTAVGIRAEARLEDGSPLPDSPEQEVRTGLLATAGPPLDGLQAEVSLREGAAAELSHLVMPISCNDAFALVAFDAQGEVVWYERTTSIKSLHLGEQHELVYILDKQHIERLSFTGERGPGVDFNAEGQCSQGSGPCPHHDAMLWDGDLWALTASLYSSDELVWCKDEQNLAVDGLHRFSANAEPLAAWSLAELGWDPEAVDWGPGSPPACDSTYWGSVLGPEGDPPVNFLHANSLDVYDEDLLVSVAGWDQLARIQPEDGQVVWRLHATNPEYSDFAPLEMSDSVQSNDAIAFSLPHHATQMSDGRLQFLDNAGGEHPRVLRISLDEEQMEGRIDEVYTVVDADGGRFTEPQPMHCPSRGSAEELPSGAVLVSCGEQSRIVQLDVPDGSWDTGPAWQMRVTCSGQEAGGIYRAYTVPAGILGPP